MNVCMYNHTRKKEEQKKNQQHIIYAFEIVLVDGVCGNLYTDYMQCVWLKCIFRLHSVAEVTF